MERRMKMKRTVAILMMGLAFFMLFITPPVYAGISIAVTGSWFETIDENDLISGAGSDLQSVYTSVSGQVLIDISGTTGPEDAWRIDVRKINANWNNALHPHVMRTSAGSGGSVSGGTSFQEVTEINSPFFFGAGDVTGIKIQLKMTGASIQIDPDSYSTELYYTIVDIP